MPTTPPSPLGALSKTIFAAPFGLGQKIEHLFQYWLQLAAGETPEWRRFVINCEDLVSTDLADDAKITFDIVNYTGGAIDTSWTDSDYTFVFNTLDDIPAYWAARMDNAHRFNRIDAYRMTFRDSWVGSSPSAKLYPFNLTGPPEDSAALSIAGTGGLQFLPPQAAFSVTEMTPIRRSWGRFYLPFPEGFQTMSSTTNRWKDTVVTEVANVVRNTYNALAAQEFYPVVPITQSQGNRVGALETVSGVRADDVCDVIRSRRSKHALFHQINEAAATKEESVETTDDKAEEDR